MRFNCRSRCNDLSRDSTHGWRDFDHQRYRRGGRRGGQYFFISQGRLRVLDVTFVGEVKAVWVSVAIRLGRCGSSILLPSERRYELLGVGCRDTARSAREPSGGRAENIPRSPPNSPVRLGNSGRRLNSAFS